LQIMKFIITAVAAVVATSSVVSGMEAPELRGPVLIDALMGSSKSSKSSSSRNSRSGSSKSSKSGSGRSGRSDSSKSGKSSADLFDRQFVDVGSKSSKSNGSSRAASSSKSSKSGADLFDRQFADVGSKSSKSNGSSRAASSSKSSKSGADMFDRQFVDVGTSSKSSKSNSGSARAGGSDSSKSGKSTSSDMFEDRQFEEVAVPKFFPADMSEELLDEFRRRNGNSNGNPSKQNASQKRQAQRDARREIDNPNRSQREEDTERARKTKQSERRGNRSTDPYDDSSGQQHYGARREATRVRTCERTGDSCRFSGPNSWCYNDCVDDIGSRGAARNGRNGGQRVDQECSRQCRFIDAECYDICRNDDRDSISFCLDDCEKNIDDEGMRRRIEDRTDRSDYPRINDCEGRCRSVSNKNGRRTDCFVRCDGDGFSSSSGDFDDFTCRECRDINNSNRRNNCLDDNNCR